MMNWQKVWTAWRGLWLPALALFASGKALGAEPDVRRDATVLAVEQVMPSIVNIATETLVPVNNWYYNMMREFYGWSERRIDLGSGVIIDEEGDILTNYHVVQGASRVQVKLWDGRVYDAEPLVGTTGRDVALLRMKSKAGEKFKPIKFAPDDDLLLGETVLAVGNPFGFGGSVSRGILSSKTRRPSAGNEPLDVNDWLQTDAAINPGNSGGPLVNLRGELIGLNVAISPKGQGIGFAIPVKQVGQAVSSFFSPEVTHRLWFGAHLKAGADPIVVAEVQPNGPADKAGLRAGDRILEINSAAPGGFIQLNRLLGDSPAHKAELLIEREGQKRTIVARLVPLEEMIRSKVGFTLSAMKKEATPVLGNQSVKGMLIEQVEKESPAERAQLQAGYLLIEIDGLPANDVRDVGNILSSKQRGEVARLTVVVQRKIGTGFVEYRQGTVEVLVR